MKFFKQFKFTIALSLIAAGLFLYWPKESIFKGDIFGTYYKIVVYHPKWQSKAIFQQEINEVFKEMNAVFSTYDSNSLISQFNTDSSLKPFKIPPSFKEVFDFGTRLFQQSEGAWDASAYPLFKIWKAESPAHIFPKKETVYEALSWVDYSKLKIDENFFLNKQHANQSLDFSSIAKGYAIDKIWERLKALNSKSAFIEIGGEVRVLGKKPNNDHWRLGIQNPLMQNKLFEIVNLDSGALATSGDYQQFFEYKGKQYSHIINPKMGYPILKDIASVSVIATTCMQADGYATVLMVMDIQKGLALIESLANTEALILQYGPNGTLKPYYSSGFKQYLVQK